MPHTSKEVIKMSEYPANGIPTATYRLSLVGNDGTTELIPFKYLGDACAYGRHYNRIAKHLGYAEFVLDVETLATYRLDGRRY